MPALIVSVMARDRIGAEFGIVDLSLAPTAEIGDSVGEILEVMGVRHVGGPGSTAALALLNDAAKKGGAVVAALTTAWR